MTLPPLSFAMPQIWADLLLESLLREVEALRAIDELFPTLPPTPERREEEDWFEEEQEEDDMAVIPHFTAGFVGTQPSAVVTSESLNWNRTVFFFMLDVIPDYIQKTFGVNEEGHFPRLDPRRTVREGETIPTDLDVAVIVYNYSDYHLKTAYEVLNGIKAVSPGTTVVMLPVFG